MKALAIGSGIVVWAAHFTLLYGFAALACARGFAQALPWVAGAAGALAAALAAAIVVVNLRRDDRFEAWLGASVAALALLAIVWETLPVFMLGACETSS
jgi:membrane associated rhomboid family serine protease